MPAEFEPHSVAEYEASQLKDPKLITEYWKERSIIGRIDRWINRGIWTGAIAAFGLPYFIGFTALMAPGIYLAVGSLVAGDMIRGPHASERDALQTVAKSRGLRLS